jgi:hypothetical protein
MEHDGSEKMKAVVIETYVVKTEKQAEYKSLVKKFLKYMKENPALFKELKSIKLFTQTFGGICGAYVEQMEFNSLAELERFNTKVKKDKEYQKLYQQAMLLIDATTFSESVWEPVI